MPNLQNKIAVVTGASKGIGAEIALSLAQAGANVVITYATDCDGAIGVRDSIENSGGRAWIIQGDVSNPHDVKSIFDLVKQEFGRVDILINNAGIYGMNPIGEVTAEQFEQYFNVNVLGVILCNQHALPLFPESGGAVVNIGSTVTSFTPENSVLYTATKGAVDTITRTLSKEWGSRGIRVNSVNPGLTETTGLASSGFSAEHFKDAIAAQTPLGRIGKPKDIAPAVAFLASDDASWITGEILCIGGGLR